MYCPKCGAKLTENANFCNACGNNIKNTQQSEKNTDNKESISPIFMIILIFIPIFIVAMLFNQISYGGCFKGYCLSAAFPKVAIISAVITGIFYAATRSK